MTYQPHQSEDATLKPVAVEFTAEEAQRGRAMRGNTLHYCCYGMYCDAGHSSDCRFAPKDGVDVPRAPGPAPEDSYPDQTVLHDERNVGNCLQATIAGVLGWPLAAVPHFALLGEDHWWDCAQAWLDSQGYWIDYQPTSYAKEGGELLPRCWLSGRSPRGFSHAVIGDTTTLQVLHDPHPTRAGLLAVDYTIYFFRKPANSQAIDPRFAAAHYQDGRDLTYGVRVPGNDHQEKPKC